MSKAPAAAPVEWVDGAETLARDAVLLREGLPAVRVAILARPCLSLGVGQRDPVPSAERARRERLPVVRRSTGGTSVLIGRGDIAWSVVLPREDPRVGRDYVRAYARFGGAATRSLVSASGEAAWVPGPGLSAELCYLSGRGQVLTIGGKVVGGAAQHRTSTALLHHGSIALRVDRTLLRRLFDLPEEGGFDRLAGVEELGVVGGSEGIARRLRRELAQEFAVEPVP